MIPPCGDAGHSSSDEAEAAAIEFALLTLPVRQIIVCGHSECGAMHAISQGLPNINAPNLKSWLRHGEGALQQLGTSPCLGNHLERHNQISQLNVLEQLGHLMTYPVVQKRLKEGTLKLHGWWFDIKEANVYEYEPKDGVFRLIDEEFAEVLIERTEEE
jgi:carbonic anhydrase